MHDLKHSLQNTDKALLPVLARIWGVDARQLAQDELIGALVTHMRDETRAETVWQGLDDAQRGALQTLMASGRKMVKKQFETLYGEYRKMGPGLIEREQPLRNPQSIAEGLYYRGLISEGYEKSGSGMRPMLYVPDDLAAVLPLHKTQYEHLEAEPEDAVDVLGPVDIEAIPEDDLIDKHPADTSLVDDMTTLLAYLRVNGAQVEEDSFLPGDVERITPHLLVTQPARLAFLLAVGVSADLITTQEGRAYPKASGGRVWLAQSRAEQVRALARSWVSSGVYRDLNAVPGLHPEPDGIPYDPAATRQAVLRFIAQAAPASEWWSLDEFIETLKIAEPVFARTEFDSWYIKNDEGEYLRGFESWDAVEGALIEFICQGPMHWLGLVDLAADAVRLTAYGRALLELMPWPNPPDKTEPIIVNDDATLIASRRVSRLDRFQLARFTTWNADAEPYTYKLDGAGIERGARQGITTQHIAAFISRQLDDQRIPPIMTRLLETWQGGGGAAVSIEQLVVLRTQSEAVLDRIFNEPQIRRFLGARLGPTAVIVRPDQRSALQAELDQAGIRVEVG